MNSESFGDRLAAIRNAANQKQQEFATMYQKSKRTWSDYETGKASPDVALVIQICKDWNVNPRWLLRGTGEMFETETKKSKENVQEIMKDLPLAEVIEVQRLITDLLAAKISS